VEPTGLIFWRDSDRRFLPALVILVVLLAVTVALLFVVFTVVKVDGDSMSPALQHQDRLLMTRGYDSPRRGDIVEFPVVGAGGTTDVLLKRVVAIPGDTVNVAGDVVYVNGQLSQVAPGARIGPQGRPKLSLTLPEGMVYVLGDNRPVSLDSRHIGPIPLTAIRGRAIAVLLPLTRIRSLE
jgi:signal peptidase I